MSRESAAGSHARFRVIPVEQAVEHTLWETPDVTEPERRRRQAQEEAQEREAERARRERRREKRRLAVKERLRQEDEARRALPTVEEIEALQESARKEGHKTGYKEGQEAGYQDGYAAGFQQGEEDGRHSGAALVERLRALLDTLGRPLERLDESTEDELTHLVFAVARRMVLEELRTDPEQVRAAVRQALRELPANQREAAIRVHPDDLPFIEEHLGQEAAGQGWSVAGDPALTRGGCVIETEISRVDATVERRLDAVAQQLFGDPSDSEQDPVVNETFRGEAPQDGGGVEPKSPESEERPPRQAHADGSSPDAEGSATGAGDPRADAEANSGASANGGSPASGGADTETNGNAGAGAEGDR